jgi:pantoate--beta-alanine ligase
MHAGGERDAVKIGTAISELISEVKAAKIDYISIADLNTLDELERIEGQALVSLAVKLGKPRLIDNTILG